MNKKKSVISMVLNFDLIEFSSKCYILIELSLSIYASGDPFFLFILINYFYLFVLSLLYVLARALGYVHSLHA